ncbi:DUF4861 domain-containing protein [Coprobacter sp.]
MKYIFFLFFLFTGLCLQAQPTTKVYKVRNNSNEKLTDAAIVLPIQNKSVKGITVYCQGKEIASQLDDLNQDGIADEIIFLSDFKRKEKKEFTILFSEKPFPENRYTARVHAQMFKKEKDKSITPITEASSPTGTLYNKLHHHGPAFESEFIAYRIYFDKKQTVDVYGKFYKQLELSRSLWYPTDEQLKEGFGDDILRVSGSTGVGTLKGWNGKKAIHIEPVDNREAKIIANGPLRTVVDMNSDGWQYNGKKINLKSRYILYSGHRDVEVYNTFSGNTDSMVFCTGVQKIKGGITEQNGKDRIAVWGTDFPVNDTVKYGKQTLGLAVDLRKTNCIKPTEDKVNYLFLVKPDKNNQINYRITVCSQKETFGYHKSKDFFKYVRNWTSQPCNLLEINY